MKRINPNFIVIIVVVVLTVIINIGFLLYSNNRKESQSSSQNNEIPVVTEYDVYYLNTSYDYDEENIFNLYPVTRSTSHDDAHTFLIQELLLGPTEQEKSEGFSQSLELFDPSTNQLITFISPQDTHNYFQTSLDGSALTINFDGEPSLAGSLSGGRINEQIFLTLSQLPDVETVNVLFNSNPCWDDLSGECVE